ncbi:hypothetical protein [Streptomyces tibetensis]|uniref:hypothetical protein n=1 Tax=Streptomyces tibetensis TaxID=2382123 RepID=UPI0033D23B9C
MAAIRDFLGAELAPGHEVLFVLDDALRQGKIVAIEGEDIKIREQDEDHVHTLAPRPKHPTVGVPEPGRAGFEEAIAAMSQRSDIVRLPLH